MIRVPPRSTRTDTLFPYTTLFRSPRSPSAVWSCGERREMTKLPYLPETSALPGAHDPGRAEPWMERWRAAAAAAADPALHEFAQRLAQDPRGQRLLQAIFANSPTGNASSRARVGQYV